MIPKVQARTFVLPHLPYVIFKAILVANYLYINQKENTFFALQGVPFAFWFCFFFTQKQAALETSHHSPDYYSLTSIFGFVPPLWLKQRQLKCNTNQADIPLPSSSPSPKGEKKRNLTSAPPHLLQLNLMTCQLISISLLWKLLKFSTSEAHKLIAQQTPQQRKYWPSTHAPTQKTSKSPSNIFAIFHFFIILASFDSVNS